MEQTLVLIKPDAIKKSLTGHILTHLARADLEIVAARMVRVEKTLAEEHYIALKGQPFFEELIDYITGRLHACTKVLALVYSGENAIQKVRVLCGATNPEEADPTSIRGAYGRITTKGVFENVIHASADPRDAEREIKLWFTPEDVLDPIYPVKEQVWNGIKTRVWA
ncbi:MAG: nucleoside-diphosphate kinase [Deltaproteobacteria bacterium]|nr:nucleoside-diphosphate kinase [Deltaproteobacteria bacterium]